MLDHDAQVLDHEMRRTDRDTGTGDRVAAQFGHNVIAERHPKPFAVVRLGRECRPGVFEEAVERAVDVEVEQTILEDHVSDVRQHHVLVGPAVSPEIPVVEEEAAHVAY